MASSDVKIVLSADDKTGAAFSSAAAGLGNLGSKAQSINAILASVGVGVSIGGIIGMVKSSIDAADALQDLSQKVGIGVQSLAQYELAAKQSGASLETIAKGVKGLSVNMTEHGDALRAAGITAKDADGAMRQLADTFARMPDGMEKTALAVKLFGKSGMDMIPMLNLGSKGLEEAAVKSAKYAAAMAVLAPQADKFSDQLAELSMSSHIFGLTLANEAMPALINISGAMAKAAQEAGGLKALWVGLGGIGAAIFTDDLMTPLAKVDKQIGKLKDSMDGYNPVSIFGPSMAKMKADLAALEAQRVTIVAQQEKDKPKTEPPKLDTAAWTAEYKKFMAALGVGTAQAAKAGVDEFQVLMTRINAKDVGLDTSYHKDLATLNAGYLAGRVGVDDYAKAVGKLVSRQKFHVDALKEEKDFLEELNKAEIEARQESIKSLEADEKEVAQQREHNAEIGLSVEALSKLRDARMEAAISAKEQELTTAQLNGRSIEDLAIISHQIEALRELRHLRSDGAARQAEAAAAAASAAEWKKGWEETDRIAHEAFTTWATDGSNAAQKIGDTLKSALLSAIYEATIKPIAFQVYNSAAGALGMPGGASGGAGGVMSAASGANNLSNLLGGGSMFSGFGAGYASMVGEMAMGSAFVGPSAALASGSVGAGASAAGMLGGGAGMLGSIGTALPWIGAGLIVADAIGLFGKGGGPQSGQYGSIGPGGYSSSYTASGGDNLGNQSLASSAYGQAASLLSMAGMSSSALTLNQGYKLDPQGSSAGLAYRDIVLNGKVISGGNFDGNNGAQWTGAHDDAAGAAAYLSKLDTSEILKLTEAIGDPALSATVGKLAANFTDLNQGMTQYVAAQQSQQQITLALMTEEERKVAQLADAHKALDSTFGSLGISVPATAADFRKLVSSIDITTQAGQNEIAKLAGVKDAFLAVGAAADEAAKKVLAVAAKQHDLDIQLLEATGKTAEATATKRADALATLDNDQQRATQQQIWAAQDAAAAIAKAQQSAASAAQQAAQQQLAAQQAIRDGWQQTANSIADTVKKLRGELLTGPQSFTSAQAQFASALAATKGGDQNAANSLPALAQAVVDLGKTVTTTGVEQALLTSRTVASLVAAEQGMAKYGVKVPGFAAGGFHAGGLRIVGENGPELEATGSARIYNLEQMRAMVGGNSDLRDEMRALRAVLEDFSASNSLENGAVATATGKIARILERVTPDNDALSVRTAA